MTTHDAVELVAAHDAVDPVVAAHDRVELVATLDAVEPAVAARCAFFVFQLILMRLLISYSIKQLPFHTIFFI